MAFCIKGPQINVNLGTWSDCSLIFDDKEDDDTKLTLREQTSFYDGLRPIFNEFTLCDQPSPKPEFQATRFEIEWKYGIRTIILEFDDSIPLPDHWRTGINGAIKAANRKLAEKGRPLATEIPESPQWVKTRK